MIGTVRGAVAGPAGRNRPREALLPIEHDRHALNALIYLDEDIGLRRQERARER